ncbi:hypothetical protein [Candidatus Liberibacter asiaticus]|uniref:hypothetical protein n=1 Tax=Liberibacter asiaticus TaxID=34021 RepID=UPI0012F4B712|nr:hypothetical protein [Candidatus Liberibacter asiaticus]KAE9512833.1 flagellin modification protein A [Candidatus Liberibacter asiaticus]
MIRKVNMEKLNFEQTKSVTYWAVGSKFVIPWDIKDPSRIHAEVGYSDGRVQELAISQDFDVDGLNALLTVNNREGDFIRIFEGEKQTFKEYNSDSPRAPHNLVKEADLYPLHNRLDGVETIVSDLNNMKNRIQELEQIDLSKLEQIDLSKMAVLTQKMNIIDGVVKDLATQTKDVGRKLEQIDVSKLEQIDLSKMAVLTQKMNIIDGIVNNLATQTEDVGRKLEQIDLSKLEQIDLSEMAVLTQKMNIIDGIVNNLATQTKDVGRKLEQIDLSKLEQIDLSKLEQIDLSKLEQIDLSEMAVLTQKMNIIDGIVNDLATQTEVVGRKLEQIDLSKLEQIDLSEMAVLTQKMNIVDGRVNDLATQTKDVGRKLEQIDLSKLEGLDPQTRKYLQDIQTQLTSDTLTLQHEDTRRYASSISFKGNDGALVGWITREVIGDLKGLSIATKNQSGSLVNSVKLYDNMDVYIQGQCFIRGTDTSIFDEIKRQLKPYILGLLQGRTMVRSANLREKASIGDIITGDKIDYWAYPSENGSGYISASATQAHTMAVSAEDARKRWRIMGITRSYYYTGYWLQEVINFDD